MVDLLLTAVFLLSLFLAQFEPSLLFLLAHVACIRLALLRGSFAFFCDCTLRFGGRATLCELASCFTLAPFGVAGDFRHCVNGD